LVIRVRVVRVIRVIAVIRGFKIIKVRVMIIRRATGVVR
jgi:hypothetical protein